MRPREALLLAAAIGTLAGLALTSCSGEATYGCRVNADCASAVCRSDYTCLPLLDGGAVPDAGAKPDAGTPDAGEDPLDGGDDPVVDGGSTPDAGSDPTPDAGTPGCLPNNDGRIEAREVPIRAGLYATFAIAQDVAFDTKGVAGVWDLSKAFTGDERVRVDLEPIDDKWYADSFPDATYVAKLSQADALYGIFKVTSDTLLLLGVASETDGLSATKLSYGTPIVVMKYPLEVGKTWTTESTVTGTASGFVSYYSETYTTTVDKAGTMKTPYATFPVLRVNTQLDRLVGFFYTHIRQHAYVSECFGTVASVGSDSADSVTTAEFTTAAEIRRLSP